MSRIKGMKKYQKYLQKIFIISVEWCKIKVYRLA